MARNNLLIFGLGYTASVVAAQLDDWEIAATGSAGNLDFDDREGGISAIDRATHILSSVPPDAVDPVLARYGAALADGGKWLGYLSSTGVYGDAGGAWVDESAPILGRRQARNRADADWLSLGARVFRLPGIYGPGRSPLDRVRSVHGHDRSCRVASRRVTGSTEDRDGARQTAGGLDDDLDDRETVLVEVDGSLEPDIGQCRAVVLAHSGHHREQRPSRQTRHATDAVFEQQWLFATVDHVLPHLYEGAVGDGHRPTEQRIVSNT